MLSKPTVSLMEARRKRPRSSRITIATLATGGKVRYKAPSLSGSPVVVQVTKQPDCGPLSEVGTFFYRSGLPRMGSSSEAALGLFNTRGGIGNN